MAIVYFDSSALVKLLVEEAGSELAASLWDACDAPVSSRLAYPEVRAALAAAHRANRIDDAGLRATTTAWTRYWAAVRVVELTEDVGQAAGQLAMRHALRGADAVHLASATALGVSSVVVAVWDDRLRAGAEAVGLITAGG